MGLAGAGSVFLYSATRLEDILREVVAMRPRAVIVDSIQTVYLDDVAGSAGSVSQARAPPRARAPPGARRARGPARPGRALGRRGPGAALLPRPSPFFIFIYIYFFGVVKPWPGNVGPGYIHVRLGAGPAAARAA